MQTGPFQRLVFRITNSQCDLGGVSRSAKLTPLERVLFLFCQTPRNGEGVTTLAPGYEPTLLHGFYGIAIGGQGTDYFVVFQSAQNRVAAKRVSFKLVPKLHVRENVLFSLRQFRRGASGSLLCHSTSILEKV
jgi:hypothetical protein